MIFSTLKKLYNDFLVSKLYKKMKKTYNSYYYYFKYCMKYSSFSNKIMLFFLSILMFSMITIVNFMSPLLVKGSLNYFFTYVSDVVYIMMAVIDNWSSMNFNKFLDGYSIDMDSTTNTDGEDLLSYMNDFAEISLQESAYFFDWILANPFEFLSFMSFSYMLYNVIFKMKIKTPSNIFKSNKNKKLK